MEINLTPDYKAEILTAVDVAEASLARAKAALLRRNPCGTWPMK